MNPQAASFLREAMGSAPAGGGLVLVESPRRSGHSARKDRDGEVARFLAGEAGGAGGAVTLEEIRPEGEGWHTGTFAGDEELRAYVHGLEEARHQSVPKKS